MVVRICWIAGWVASWVGGILGVEVARMVGMVASVAAVVRLRVGRLIGAMRLYAQTEGDKRLGLDAGQTQPRAAAAGGQ